MRKQPFQGFSLYRTAGKKIHFFVLFSLLSCILCAQQKPLFTNYVFNDYFYNPAIASIKEGADFTFIYRHQWAGLDGQPQTAAFSTCGSFRKFPLGIGGNFYFDKTGPLHNTGFNISASYGIRLGDLRNKSMIAAGIAAGLIRFSLDENATHREPNDAAVTAARDGRIAPDIGIGIYYKWKGLFAGFSVPQVMQSKLDLGAADTSDMNRLIRHYLAAAGCRFRVADKFEVEPSFLLKAVKAAPLQGDISFKAVYDQMVWLGASYRTLDAACIFAGVLIKDMLEIGYAYDITTSALNSVSNGSHEVMAAYRWKRPLGSSSGVR